METLSVRCNHCGAPLQVAENTRFLNCQFCHSSLEVKRTGSTVVTEEIAKMAEIITLQNDLEKLDRDWENRPARDLITWSRTGKRSSTNPMLGLWVAIFLTGVAFTATLFMNVYVSAGFVKVLLIVIGLLAGISFILQYARYRQGSAARESYQKRRAALESQIESLRQK